MSERPLYVVPDGVETRWASAENPKGEKGAGGRENAGRKGRPAVPIKDRESLTLAEVSGTSGTVHRIWVTINDRSPVMLRGLRLEAFWDGTETPAVSAPLGDFFGTGLGRMARFECAPFGSPEGRSFNCRIPMPFRSGMRMVVTNESGRDLGSFFYDVDYTVGDDNADALYLHAHWRRENPTTMQEDYEILPRVEGKGRFLGTNIGVIADTGRYFNSWWGEGEVKVYLDGDTDLPTLCGTGTEDYIGTGWGQGRYARMYQGCHVADHDNMQYCFYRYHIPDPIYFHEDARVTIQQIGCWSPNHIARFDHAGEPIYKAGPGREEVDFSRDAEVSRYGLFEREDDWSSCAYFYLGRPENGLPELAPVEERTADLPENPPVAGGEGKQ
ncbi:MAG: glycoside hydrolase family 172 protein [Candidatus Brocadiia bacterium]